MRATEDVFRTFCHISEYGPDGYANLHRLLAASSPLVLWAPSSALLYSLDCRIGPEDFLRYVDQRHIRVIGRERWLTDANYRDAHDWDGARWDASVDRQLARWADEDKTMELSQRRVVVAANEIGEDAADERLKGDHSAVKRILSALRQAESKKEIPRGVFETAERRNTAGTDEGFVKWVLRDAINHIDALRVSGAAAPFLLQPKESRFIALMDDLLREGDSLNAAAHESGADKLTASNHADLTREVTDVLARLDRLRRKHSKASIHDFVRRGDQQILAQWMSNLCAKQAKSRPGDLRDAVSDRLREDFDAGRFNLKDSLLEVSALFGHAGALKAIHDAVLSDVAHMDKVGVFTAVLGYAHTIGSAAGLLPHRSDVPRWPFLYTFGSSGVSGRKIDTLLDCLEA